jgi:DNA-binding MarR family transcriptional regulator
MSSVPVSQPEDGSLSLRNYHLIHELYVLLDAYDRETLGRFGLIASQYRLLMILAARPGQRLTELSARMLLSKSTISRTVEQLEAMGWVSRLDDPHDRRAQCVMLTPLGYERQAAISNIHLQSLEERLRCIPKPELEQLESLLKRISSGFASVQLDCDEVLSTPGGVTSGVQSKEVKTQSS